MFPNIRLMIAAMVASIVALSCGFGVFAAFRVNHEPLVRLPPVTAPLQLIAGNSAAVAVAVAEPFDRRFQTSPPQRAARATEPPTLRRDDREGVESAPAASAAVPDRGAAEAAEPAAAVAATESAVGPAAPAVPTVLPEHRCADCGQPPARCHRAGAGARSACRRRVVVAGNAGRRCHRIPDGRSGRLRSSGNRREKSRRRASQKPLRR